MSSESGASGPSAVQQQPSPPLKRRGRRRWLPSGMDRPEDAAGSPAVKKTTVLVIGAGLSGLSAAKLLSERGIDVIILEARDRVGGRLFTIKNEMVGWVDLGGSYVGPTQNHILRLANELQVDTYKIFDDLKMLHFSEGKAYPYETTWAHFGINDPLAWFDINYVMRRMDIMMEQVPAVDPWNCPHAEEWDAMTLQSFFEKESWTKGCREYLSALAQVNLSSEPSQVSLLWALWYIKCCGGNRRMCSTFNGAQADYVIMAIPLPMQLKVHYEPPLPSLRNQLIQRTPVGSAFKMNIYYAKPFWREAGYGGIASCFNDELAFTMTTDDCRPGFSLAALTVFAIGDKALRLQELPKQVRPKVIADDLARAFEHEAAYNPVHFEEKNWLEEQYSGGCYVSTFPTGVMSKYGKTLREPFGRVYFAGTETATVWPGYMNGAVQAGERAAREVLCAMKLLRKDQIWEEEPEFKGVKAQPFEMSFLERHPPHVLLVATTGAVAASSVVCVAGYCFWKAVTAMRGP
ncbi:hypothetical protein HPB50_015546 [Hyalomma asiaticum]|uniref:Uncharacterized protein n=1 Tax=Hyalomma asiaticum TaxID=266040 RepID=A0ACB7T263_HYAAI|nr:hypothetical protein HPB50_015546 [Hyalomma asiaticum]